MIYNSILIHQHFLYCRLQGLIWETNGLNTSFNLDTITGGVLSTIYREEEKRFPLIINCNGIIDNDDHGFSPIFSLIDEIKRPIYFLNSNHLIIRFRRLRDEFIKGDFNVNEPDKKTFIISLKRKALDAEELYPSCEILENDLIKEFVYNCFEKFNDDLILRLPSTPIAANGVFNSSNLISDPKSFMWISIKLSDKLNSFLKETLAKDKNLNTIKLLSVSLRSSPFAAAIGLLNKIEIDVIDHLGPKNKIFDIEELQNIFWTEQYQEYIYIGDFIFGGTEVKIAQAYAVLTGCKLEKALVIGSLFPVESFSDCFNLSSLIDLKGLNEGAKFALFEENI
ncbi:MAG: hypothetical protein Q8J88_15610 [Bacteroidales bacterium]|nr:hypothetical protein [Bacteroidales bacterium]